MIEEPNPVPQPPPLFEASFVYSQFQAKRAFWALLRPKLGRLAIGGILVPILCVLLIALGATWAGWAGLGAFSLLWVFVINGYRRAGDVARNTGEPPIRIWLTEDAMGIVSPLASSIVKWPGIALVQKTPEFVFLTRKDTVHLVPIPRLALSVEALGYLEKKVVEAGGKVR